VLSRSAAISFGIADLLTGAVVGLGVFVALPARWWPVDVPAFLLTAIELSAGVALVARTSWAERLARVACIVALSFGLFTVSVLAVTASWLGGVYGPVGRGGAIVLALVALLALPYVVVLPVVQLVWLRPRGQARD
jgi:hypothetical protein